MILRENYLCKLLLKVIMSETHLSLARNVRENTFPITSSQCTTQSYDKGNTHKHIIRYKSEHLGPKNTMIYIFIYTYVYY